MPSSNIIEILGILLIIFIRTRVEKYMKVLRVAMLRVPSHKKKSTSFVPIAIPKTVKF